jgi:hypothetical protein
MATLLYCWRCDADVPMLTEDEWARMDPVINESIRDLKAFRQRNDCSLADALRNPHGRDALDFYCAMTGMRETNVAAIWHHRLSLYGPPCQSCGKPLRTPRAKLCAACGELVGPARAT